MIETECGRDPSGVRIGLRQVGFPAVLVVCVVVLAVLVLSWPTGGEVSRSAQCAVAEAGVQVDAKQVPEGPVAGYGGEQLINAAAIVNAGHDLGLDTCAQTIGVMTAMGESSLRVLDRGDAVGPDSRGLFQQRANGAWAPTPTRWTRGRARPTSSSPCGRCPTGPRCRRRSPPTARSGMPTPYHYERYWDAAVEVVTALAGRPVTGVRP